MHNEKIIDLNGIHLYTQSFGNNKNPVLLLIIGAGSQCLLWPGAFCESLAENGFFVIRYDHRDTGRSSAIDYETSPYTVMDLASDAIGVLSSYEISAAHIVGFSMGGQIAQFIGAYFPNYALTLTLIATSTNFLSGFNAFAGVEYREGLTPPIPRYVRWATQANQFIPISLEEKIETFLMTWQLLNGEQAPFDEELYRQIAYDSFTRSNLDAPYPAHAKAMQASYKEHEEACALIKQPTLILHGDQDPVFQLDHAEALDEEIANSRLVIVEGMGHNLNTHFYNRLILEITNHATSKSSKPLLQFV